MKNTLIHNCIGCHTNCFMSLLGQSSVTTNFEKSLFKIKSQIILQRKKYKNYNFERNKCIEEQGRWKRIKILKGKVKVEAK